MRTPQFDADALLPLFRRRQIVTMDEMKATLGTTVDRTVFRKLREFPYHSSYSHRGKFYTLDALADFDERGLWKCRGALFSRFGTLIDTVEQFVTRCASGCLAAELAGELQVPVKQPLLKLVSARRLVRQQVAGQYVYCATDAAKRTEQLHQRHTFVTAQTLPFLREPVAKSSDETKAAIILFLSTLDERQRRLYAGLESLRLGHGGDRQIAALTGLDVHTIAKGRDPNCLSATYNSSAFGALAQAVRGWKKNTANHRRDPKGNGAPHRGRPNQGPEVDAQDDPEDQC